MQTENSVARSVSRSRFARPLALALAVLLAGGGFPAAAAEPVRTPFSVPRFTCVPLSPAQERVRDDSIRAVEADIDGFVARYVTGQTAALDDAGHVVRTGTGELAAAMLRGPLVVGTDQARELFAAYAASRAGRAEHTYSVFEAASAVAREVWRRALTVPDPRGNNRVLFTAGGCASGKSTALATFAPVRALASSSQIIYDSTMQTADTARGLIREALAQGKTVHYLYVHTPIEIAARWLALRTATDGRVVNAEGLASSHWKAQNVALALSREFASEPRVVFSMVETLAAAPGYRSGSIEELSTKLYSRRLPSLADFEMQVQFMVGSSATGLAAAGPAPVRNATSGRLALGAPLPGFPATAPRDSTTARLSLK